CLRVFPSLHIGKLQIAGTDRLEARLDLCAIRLRDNFVAPLVSWYDRHTSPEFRIVHMRRPVDQAVRLGYLADLEEESLSCGQVPISTRPVDLIRRSLDRFHAAKADHSAREEGEALRNTVLPAIGMDDIKRLAFLVRMFVKSDRDIM